MSSARKELENSLNKLSLAPKNHKTSKSSSTKTKKASVADSWEDEDEISSGEDTDRALTTQESRDYPDPPPPTPISPSSPYSSRDADRFISPYGDIWSPGSDSSRSSGRDGRSSDTRPEKTDAVAKRLVAGALGMRAPKKTEEQRAYDRAVKEKEMKRRNTEKEAKLRAEEEAEKAKAAVWGD